MARDPRFPYRPDHPDFWLLSEAVKGNDARADAGIDLRAILATYADPASVTYMAEARIQRFGAQLSLTSSTRLALQAAWLDAFTAGVRFQQLKDSTTDNKEST